MTGRVITDPTLIARDARSPAWSRDGRYLAYVSNPTSFSSDVVLRIHSVETGETRELYPRLSITQPIVFTGNMHWFPDGSAVLVRARDLVNRMGFFRIDSQTGAVSLVWSTGDSADMVSGSPVLSPDGKTLFFARDVVNSQMQIIGVDLEKRTERVVVSTEGAVIMNAIAVSPDGQRLAFEGFSPEDVSQSDGTPPLASLYVVQASGGESVLLHRLEEPHGINMVHGEVEWSADGRYVFFATVDIAATGLHSRLWRVPAGGGRAERLDQLGGSSFEDFSMRMHPNGRELAFSAGSPGGVELWVMENLFALTSQSADSP